VGDRRDRRGQQVTVEDVARAIAYARKHRGSLPRDVANEALVALADLATERVRQQDVWKAVMRRSPLGMVSPGARPGDHHAHACGGERPRGAGIRTTAHPRLKENAPMSVKLMTTKQIRDDLTTLALTWPDGIPWQQSDRVNALKGELKRRNEPFEVPVDPVTVNVAKPPSTATVAELENELRVLSDSISRDPKDEAAQQRFADIRYELRRRAKTSTDLEKTELVPTRPPVQPRELELPSDDEVVAARKAKPSSMPPELLDEIRSQQQLVPRRPYSIEGRVGAVAERAFDDAGGFIAARLDEDAAPVEQARTRATPATAGTICGFKVGHRDDGTVAFGYRSESGDVNLGITRRLTVADVDALIVALLVARGEAAARAAKQGG
jgi:hypothetical protein